MKTHTLAVEMLGSVDVVDSMFNQHAKWLTVTPEIRDRKWPS